MLLNRAYFFLRRDFSDILVVLIVFLYRHFSENNVRAMDETWYKRAVDQHSIEPESFVFSVPFDVGNNGKPLVTATHAVFIEHKGHRAPVAVVGLQFQHSVLASHFLNNITSATVNIFAKCHQHKLINFYELL